MNIDETIAHAREVAERNKRAMNFESVDNIDDDIKINCSNCAEEHEQLAEWLEELKELREKAECARCVYNCGCIDEIAYKEGYNKAIDDFARMLKKNIVVVGTLRN